MSAIETVFKLVKDWEPGALATELKYRDSLATFLRERLKDAKIETEYRHSGTTADVYVKETGFFSSSEVFIEIKRNLQHKAALDRLVGQIQGLQPKHNKVIILLCGETNPALVTRFREVFASELLSFIECSMALIVKESTKSAKAGRS
jgi:hypothetical protein